MIPLSSPDITEQEIEAVVAVLRSPQLSLGPRLEEFERLFGMYIGVDHAIAVNSGTSGLHLCVRALGLGAGDEVIVPSFTFIAAANAIRFEGATPVFVDIDPHTFNLDPACVERAITRRTRAIMVVHTFGVPAEMDALEAIAQQHGLQIIEDACEAVGATYDKRRVGSFGAAGVFAFYPNKQITTGEGGMIVTRSAQLAERMRALRNQGRYPGSDWFQHQELGFNYRLSEISCALGIVQLRRVDEILARRAEVAAAYDQLLQDVDGVSLPFRGTDRSECSWFVYVIRLERAGVSGLRDAVAAHLLERGIGSGRYFAPIHLQPAYAPWRDHVTLPVTEAVAATTLALPFFNRLEPSQVEDVSAAIRQALRDL
jgi:perosamine synthetase